MENELTMKKIIKFKLTHTSYFNLVTCVASTKPCSVIINCAFLAFSNRNATTLIELGLIILEGIITVSPVFIANNVAGIEIFVTGLMVFT